MREQRRVVAAGGRLRAEDLDHADDRTQESQQRRRRGDRSERVEVALETVNGGASCRFEHVLQAVFADARVGDDGAHAGGQHSAQHRVLCELVDHVGGRQARPRHRNHFIEQVGWRDATRSQAGQSFDGNRQRDDGAKEQRVHRPTSGLYDRKQSVPFECERRFWDGRLWPDGIRNRRAIHCELSWQRQCAETRAADFAEQSTATVDNFVGNLSSQRARPRELKGRYGLLKL